ncbi:MAG: hypothetical protein AB7L91_17845 [Dehalococcoidia bacterium]
MAASALLLPQQSGPDDPLPRRGSLEMALAPSQAGGLEIVGFRAGSLAPAQGLQVGDRVVAIRGRPVDTPQALAAALAGLRAGERYPVELVRDGTTRTTAVQAVERAKETIRDFEARYAHVTLASGARIRTITLYPQRDALARDGRFPTVFYVHGIPCQALDGLSQPVGAVNPLLEGLLDAGFVVGFAEKPGVGDSEGVPCAEGGFDREVEAFTRAAGALRADPRVDADRFSMVGVSLGGFQAPLIASEVPFTSIVTVGTGMQPWYEYMISNFRWRYQLEGMNAAEIEPRLRVFRRVWASLLVFGQTLEEVRATAPEDAARFEEYFGDFGDAFGGRNVQFFQELDRAPLWWAWSGYRGDLLALHGEYDWVATEYDHRVLTEVVRRNAPDARVEFRIMPGLDHVGTSHASLDASFVNRFRGDRNTVMRDMIVEWLAGRATPLG